MSRRRLEPKRHWQQAFQSRHDVIRVSDILPPTPRVADEITMAFSPQLCLLSCAFQRSTIAIDPIRLALVLFCKQFVRV
jgi:hypothetical protein